MEKWSLKGKKALVTGGSKGIGEAVVRELLDLGAEVLFSGRNVEIAAAIAFLAMDKASFITGHNLVVDGGVTISAL